MTAHDTARQVLAGLDTGLTADLEALYQDLHAHPELSFEEHRTAAEVARRARDLGYEVTEGVGRTGVVARLVNGQGPTVLLRADLDALPVTERTGLPYASTNEMQTVVSRETASADRAVVTVGALQAGTKDNIIPDEARLQLNIRTYTPQVRRTVLGAVERIVRGEAVAAGAQRDPEISTLHTFPLMVNDEEACARTMADIGDMVGHDRLTDPGASSGSEDVGVFGTSANVPVCYWLLGGVDPDVYAKAEAAGTRSRDIPQNHSPFFAPVMRPTLTNGVTALTTAALAWLGPASHSA
ncbi:peptidase dimerization domain-containing protein [Streptomyces sp. NPDC056291]|uniref:peptidase dimerization domain-containing protein n=1 Tax=Streptomyces sp. NPDC056291 TaxID=3345772 RepID=UPI0035DA56AE